MLLKITVICVATLQVVSAKAREIVNDKPQLSAKRKAKYLLFIFLKMLNEEKKSCARSFGEQRHRLFIFLLHSKANILWT